uniref:Protein AUXIN-REGULATED GENE INVOLVED IN ORGAN SIZE-like n=1 Tax=Nicotiana sylvestris TaxID=4096 RepID=A0A1U7YLR2_NICSY|nr:PREDICTED: protein AUXIN-REGULATED GENE INVOLVED IN ORGAN SIZE-like [Nicotiana sylvestris]
MIYPKHLIREFLGKGDKLSNIMDVKTVSNSNYEFPRKNGNTLDYRRLFSQGQYGKRISYFSLVSLFFLLCLTASLLLLPLILPPLPAPPHFMLLLLPIFIMVLLMILAFMPSNMKDKQSHTDF